ncbi:MAG: hypothetical protein J0L61_04970 [Planctomycetes bacterium]|nr:hypothetical protein [Planctomycetota bacterium]
MKTNHAQSDGRRFRVLCALMVLAVLGGCMRMQTQQATLEHRPTVVAPDSTAVADVPESREERDRGR